MGASQPPYMYSPQRTSSQFPEKPFDPKAVTRASWEPPPRKPKPDGPLVSFNRHPDAHGVLSYRNNSYVSMSPRTKAAIKWLRRMQLVLRLLEMNAALGILALMILITGVESVTHWVLRITPGVVAVLCAYAVFHLARDAAGRTPASSAAYHIFAGLTDLCALGIYAFGGLVTHRDSDYWLTRLEGDVSDLMHYFGPAVFYTFVGAGALHFISLITSLWLAWVFRKITLMPPDMNPLEDKLTARPLHKRNKSSVATFSTDETDEKRYSTSQASQRFSGMSQADAASFRGPVPFMHTRTQSRDSASSNNRNSYVDLPARQYQIVPGNSPRNSAISVQTKRQSQYSQRSSYTELPRYTELSRGDSSPVRQDVESPGTESPRVAKFTETWKPTDSLISRTNHRNRELAASRAGSQARASKSYAALSQRYDVPDSDDERENDHDLGRGNGRYDNSNNNDSGYDMHPNPLRSHPSSPSVSPEKKPRAKTPFRPLTTHSLSEISTNERHISASRDIADQGYANQDDDEAFYSRPYGELKSRTPPVMIGNDRKVSSGNDYGSQPASKAYGRRNVSGKVAEEGRGGNNRFSYYAPGERRY
jgi:hypothetical protein